MSSQWAVNLTYQKIFPYDNALNWVLAALLIFFPEKIGQLITSTRVLPTLVYSATGIGFCIFAIWQDWVLIGRRRKSLDLWIAAALAFAPAVALAVALALFAPAIRPLSTGLLWAGEFYMIILGLWYVRTAKLLAQPE